MVRYRLVLLLLAVPGRLPAQAIPPQAIPPAERSRLEHDARTASEHRRFAEAMALYRRLAESYPVDGTLWYQLAVAANAAGNIREAIDAGTKAFAGGAGYRPQVAYFLARGYAELGSRDSAFAWLERALANQFTPRTVLQTDSAFARWRDDTRFRELAGFLPNRSFSRVTGWQYDLEFLGREAKRLHASFRREAYSPAFDSGLTELSARVGDLTDRQIAVQLSRVLGLLRDGHTLVEPRPDGTKLPVDFYFFSDGVFVIDGTGPGKDLVGSQVLKIGDRSIDDLVRDVAPYVPRDNSMQVKWLGPWFLTLGDFIQALGGSSSGDRATLTLRDRQGRWRRVTLEGGPVPGPPWIRKLGAPAGVAGPVPLYLQKAKEEPYWFTVVPAARAVYFQFNQVMEDRAEYRKRTGSRVPVGTAGETMEGFSTRLAAALGNPAVQNLIVDVRLNSGGNSFLFPPLLRVISGFQAQAASHRIFVITGRNTFSAAQNFSTNLERLTNAIFVGEPTGSSPNFTGEGPNFFALPYSHTHVNISNWYHQFSFWSDTRPWIAPALPAELSSTDYFANRDPAMDAIVAVIKSR